MNATHQEEFEDQQTGGFVRNSLLLVGIELFAKMVGLVLFAVMAHFLGPAEVGVFASAMAFAGLFTILAHFGFERVVEREVGRDPALFHSNLREITLIKFVLSAFSVGVFYAVMLVSGETRIDVMMLVMVFQCLFSYLFFFNSFFRAIGKSELEVLTRLVFSLLNVTMGIVVLYLGWGLLGVVTVQLASVGLAGAAAWLICERISPGGEVQLSLRRMWGHFMAAAPFAGVMLILYFGNTINIVLMTLLDTEVNVGYFAGASRLFENLTLIPAAVMGAFLPALSRLYTKEGDGFARMIRFTMKYLYIIAVPIVVGTIIVARPLTVFLYKEHFAPAVPALQILMVALLLSFWNNPLTRVLIAADREKSLIWIFALTAAVHIAGNLALIPLFSYIGASLAVIVTQGSVLIILLLTTRRYYRFRDLLALTLKPNLCVAAMGIAVYLVGQHSFLLSVLTGIFVYPTMLVLTKTVSRQDLESLRTVVLKRDAEEAVSAIEEAQPLA